MSTKIPLSAVLGNPISHSRSPRLHRHWLTRYGIRGDYIPLHVEEPDLATVLRTMPALSVQTSLYRTKSLR